MRIGKADVFLTLALTAIFIALSIVSSMREARDITWVIVSLLAVGVYSFVAVRRNQLMFTSMGRLQIIFLTSQLVGFAVYLVKSKAIQYEDTAAWLYFCPYLIVAGLIVFCIFPVCFWLCKLRLRGGSLGISAIGLDEARRSDALIGAMTAAGVGQSRNLGSWTR